MIEPAENAPQIDPQIVRGYHVPGTPYGLGERQALERVDGWILVTEVIEYEPGRRAVSRLVSPPLTEQVRTIQSVEPANGGCVYQIAFELDLPSGQHLRRELEAARRTAVHEHIARLREVLAAAHERPSTPLGHAIDVSPLAPPPRQPTDET